MTPYDNPVYMETQIADSCSNLYADIPSREEERLFINPFYGEVADTSADIEPPDYDSLSPKPSDYETPATQPAEYETAQTHCPPPVPARGQGSHMTLSSQLYENVMSPSSHPAEYEIASSPHLAASSPRLAEYKIARSPRLAAVAAAEYEVPVPSPKSSLFAQDTAVNLYDEPVLVLDT